MLSSTNYLHWIYFLLHITNIADTIHSKYSDTILGCGPLHKVEDTTSSHLTQTYHQPDHHTRSSTRQLPPVHHQRSAPPTPTQPKEADTCRSTHKPQPGLNIHHNMSCCRPRMLVSLLQSPMITTKGWRISSYNRSKINSNLPQKRDQQKTWPRARIYHITSSSMRRTRKSRTGISLPNSLNTGNC